MTLQSPFKSCIAPPGNGKVIVSLLPPSIPTVTTLMYKYPLKLLSHESAFTPELSVLAGCATRPMHLYLLTYGGGLIPGDHIDVSITISPQTRLVVTTPQGSTKIYKTEKTARRHVIILSLVVSIFFKSVPSVLQPPKTRRFMHC
jgi:urease accessory protein